MKKAILAAYSLLILSTHIQLTPSQHTSAHSPRNNSRSDLPNTAARKNPLEQRLGGEISPRKFIAAIRKGHVIRATTEQNCSDIKWYTIYARETVFYVLASENGSPIVHIARLNTETNRYEVDYRYFSEFYHATDFIAQKISPSSCQGNCCVVA